MKKLQTNQSGFTIIEVLIVLAIAGLIMLIVFLAVPALQRNSRNTQARNDAGNVLSGVGEYISANNGNLPTSISSATDGTVTFSGGTGTNSTQAKVQPGTSVSNGTSMPTATNTIVVYLNRKCNGNAFASSATNRAYAAGFVIETGGGTAGQCTES